MAWLTNFISSVQLFPSQARPPWGQMAPKQLLVSQYIWRHSWNDKSDGATSSSYTKPLFRTFSLVLVCYKQNLMCENKIKLSSFTAPCWSFIFTTFINVTLLALLLHLGLKLMRHSPSDRESLLHGLQTLTVLELLRVQSRLQWPHWSLHYELPAHLGNYLQKRTSVGGELRKEWEPVPTPVFHQWSLWVRPCGWPLTFSKTTIC